MHAHEIGFGLGLRPEHYEEIAASPGRVSWFEALSENYMVPGGGPLHWLDRIRRDYPMALHGVSLSIGSIDPLDRAYLDDLKALVGRVQPMWVSDHLCFTGLRGQNMHDLLPLPYTEEALAIVTAHVARVQERLRRRILVENPSGYLRFEHSTLEEAEFLTALAQRTGCGLLCDVNNIHVTCANLGGDADAYLGALPAEAIGEIHLAGHAVNDADGRPILIDDHGSPVAEPVWRLYERALARFGARPTLVEWDTDVPPLPTLLGEAAQAAHRLDAAARGERDVHAA